MKPLAVTTLAVLLAGCTGPVPAGDSGAVSGTVTVFAAASLTETFEALELAFEDAHPGTDVVLSFGGSSGLATQIAEGAPVDVFASADERIMEGVVDSGDVLTPVIFTSNSLEIAVPPGNPGGVTELADLTNPDLVIALCDPAVPCGNTSQALFDAAELTPSPDTLEPDVKSVLTKVELGEVDAGLVYVTDVHAAGDAVEGILFPEAQSVINLYPIGLLTRAPNPVAAQAWIDFVLSDEGQEALADAGFVAFA